MKPLINPVLKSLGNMIYREYLAEINVKMLRKYFTEFEVDEILEWIAYLEREETDKYFKNKREV